MNESDLGLMHYHYNNRSQFLYWSNTDNKDRFEQNCQDPKNREKLEKLGWLEPNCITYKYNSFGFRDEEFDSRTCGIALGCSHTEGTGLPEATAWPRVLSKLTDIHVWNLGVAGSSIDTAFRLLDHWLLKLKPKFVVLCAPNKGRLEIFDSDIPVNIIPQHQLPHLIPYYKIWASSESNADVSKRKNLLAMQQLCNQASVPFHYLDHTLLQPPGHARDLMHHGVDSHCEFAHQMYNLL